MRISIVNTTLVGVFGASSAGIVKLNTVVVSILGMPIAGLAACFFGAAFGVLFLRPTEDAAANVRQVPILIALPVLWGVGVFGGAGLAAVVGLEKPVYISLTGLVLSAGPVPIVKAAVAFLARKLGGGNGNA